MEYMEIVALETVLGLAVLDLAQEHINVEDPDTKNEIHCLGRFPLDEFEVPEELSGLVNKLPERGICCEVDSSEKVVFREGDMFFLADEELAKNYLELKTNLLELKEQVYEKNGFARIYLTAFVVAVSSLLVSLLQSAPIIGLWVAAFWIFLAFILQIATEMAISKGTKKLATVEETMQRSVREWIKAKKSK